MNRVSESPPPLPQQSPEPATRGKNDTVSKEDVRRFRELRGKDRKREDKPSEHDEQEHIPLHRKKDPHDARDQNDQQLLADRILQNFHSGDGTVSGEVVHEKSPLVESEAMEQIARMCRQLLVSKSSETQSPMRFVLKESLLPGTSLLAEPMDGGGMRLRFISKSSESLALLRKHRAGIAARARRGASKGISVEVEIAEEEAQYP